jgi:hypothetical protein
MDVISPQEREIKRCKIAMVAQILRVTGQKDICDCNLSMVVEDQSEPVLKFKVIDKLTGKEADIKAIAETEEWAMLLMHIDMDGFAIKEDGTLLLMDECGNFVYCPKDRFEVCTI